VTNIGAAEKFYDAIMRALGVPKVRKSEVRLGYGERCDGDHPDRNYLSIKVGGQPDDAPARHWCFRAPNRAAVDAFWKAGLANGGTDNGPLRVFAGIIRATTLPFLSIRAEIEWKQSASRMSANSVGAIRGGRGVST
jgi:hypothetical protein